MLSMYNTKRFMAARDKDNENLCRMGKMPTYLIHW